MVHRGAILFTAFVTVGVAQSPTTGLQFNFRGVGQMKQEDIDQALGHELLDGGERLAQFERSLKDMYTSLPKNEDGLVGHQAVRYALHRYFLHRHGWFMRGLEPGNTSWMPQRRADGSLPPAFVKEWVPTNLQNAIEHMGGDHGMTLHDMATMAATLEDLVHREVGVRLRMVYDVHDVPVGLPLTPAKGDEVLSTYLMTFLLANNLTARSRKHMMIKRQHFAKKYKGYHQVRDWFVHEIKPRIDSSEAVDFRLATQVVHDIGEKFHTFNDIECNDLRTTLNGLESRKQGRVRLSTFYNTSRFTHWRFKESADWLKHLGALDDSDSKNPFVIIPNYVLARPNCLEASNLYAVCCRSTCEDLMAHLEREIGHAKTTPARVAELVAALPSDTVQAPRELPQSLLERLDQVAASNSGEVPLHGRLFTQWMHHAFPRECPYPHETGFVNPQTADEWMRGSGQTVHVSEEEMHELIRSDVCAETWEGNPDCDQETELPWSPVEQLLSAPPTGDRSEDVGMGTLEQESMIVFGLVGLAITTLVASLLTKRRAGFVQPRGHLMLLDAKRLGILSVFAFASLAYSVDLLDGYIFSFALGASCILYVASLVSDRSRARKDRKACIPKDI